MGEGLLRAVLVGLPHPDEVIGTLVLEHLIASLASTDLSARLGFRFSIVRVGDPGGARLNEPWFGRPADLTDYVLSGYRPAASDDLGWSFPVSHKRYAFTRPLPEAAAVMAVIDREPADCLMALHDASFCGARFVGYASSGLRERSSVARCRPISYLGAPLGAALARMAQQPVARRTI